MRRRRERARWASSALICFLLIGASAGWIAGQLTKGRGFGLAGNLIVGVIGALAGRLPLLDHRPRAHMVSSRGSSMAVIGALVLLFVLSFVREAPAAGGHAERRAASV